MVAGVSKTILKGASKALRNADDIRTVLNLRTGKKETISFLAGALDDFKNKENFVGVFDALSEKGTVLGRAKIKWGEFAGMRMNAAPNSNYGEKSIYLEFLATKPDYKGIGTEIVRMLTKLSKKLGFSGNIDLMACTGSIPGDFISICGYDKCKRSAAIAYQKMGFTFGDILKDSALKKEILKGGNGLSIASERNKGGRDLFTGPMYLSKEAIEKFLKN